MTLIAAPPIPLQRSSGEAELRFKRRGQVTVIDELYQSGCLKLRFPRPEAGAVAEAVLINTAGGLTGGDAARCHLGWGAGTSAIVTSQAAERIYRAVSGEAHLSAEFSVEPGAFGCWLPQETILFDGGRLNRSNQARIAPGGRFFAVESLVFGRAAMGERVTRGSVSDSWRIHMGERLVFADRFALEGDIDAELHRPAIAAGHRALATLIYAGPDTESLLPAWRRAVDGLTGPAGCSRIGPVLVARLLGRSGDDMRRDLTALLARLLDHFNLTPALRLPRVWHC